MTFPRWITTPAARRLIVYTQEQYDAAMSEVVDSEGRPVDPALVVPPPPPPPEPRQPNHFEPVPAVVDNRMFRRGPGRPKGSKNK